MSVALTFSQMTDGERATWLDWARSHDWGQHARFHWATGTGGVRLPFLAFPCADGDPFAGGHCEPSMIEQGYAVFARPLTLRIWAGY